MPKIISLIIISIFFIQSCDAQREANAKHSPSELQDDFNQFKNYIIKDHPKFFTDISQFYKIADSQYNLIIDSMTVIEFMRILGPVVSSVKCGHTRMYLPDPNYDHLVNEAMILPLDIKIVNDSLYVLFNCSDNPDIKSGWAVKSINGLQYSTIIDMIKNCYSGDGGNEYYKLYQLNTMFNTRYYIYVDESDKFEIIFNDSGTQEEIRKTLNGIKYEKFISLRDSLDTHKEDYQHIKTTFDENNQYAILDINTFSFYENLDDFKQPVGSFFEELKKRNINNLILDIRDNDGGDPYSAVFLLSHLAKQPFPYFANESPFYADLKVPIEISENAFTGNLYTLINGFSFSTSGHLASLLKHHKIGKFIGEESGGSYACNDASAERFLDNTQIRFNIPRRTFKTAVRGLQKGRGIIPDYEISPTIEDLIDGKDAVLEKTLELIKDSK